MGVVNLPQPPVGGGPYHGAVELSHDEARVILERLRAALEGAQASSGNPYVGFRPAMSPLSHAGDFRNAFSPLEVGRVFQTPLTPEDPQAAARPLGSHQLFVAAPGPRAPGVPPSSSLSAAAAVAANPGLPGLQGASIFGPMAVSQQLQELSIAPPIDGPISQVPPPLSHNAFVSPSPQHRRPSMAGGAVAPPPPPPPRQPAPGMYAGIGAVAPVTPSQQWARAPQQVRASVSPPMEDMRLPPPPLQQQQQQIIAKPKPVAPVKSIQQEITSSARPGPVFHEGTSIPVGWKLCWTTEAEDHNCKPVTSLLYSPTFKGLHGEGNAGWLISSSRCLLNLWECSSGGTMGTSQASLTLMHSQVTDYKISDMAMDASVELLMATGMHTEAGTDCVSLHNLCPDFGFLAYKARLPVVGNYVGGGIMQRVVSLNTFGGPLSHCCAASLAGNVLVYDLPATQQSALPAKPKAEWIAHNAPITTMHRSNFSIAMFTGAADGTVNMWDLKTKPNSPVRRWGLQHKVAELCAPSEHQLVTATADGILRLWDLRYNGPPLSSVSLDGSPLLAMAHSPIGTSCAVATAKGLYTVDIPLGSVAGLGCIAKPGSLGGTVARLGWNTHTLELYISMEDGRICAYASK